MEQAIASSSQCPHAAFAISHWAVRYVKGPFTHRRKEADYMTCCWMPCRWKSGARSWRDGSSGKGRRRSSKVRGSFISEMIYWLGDLDSNQY